MRLSESDPVAHYELYIDGQFARSGTVHELSVSERLGRIPRSLRWQDGAVFETADNQGIDQWLSASRHKAAGGLWLHRLESSWSWALASVLLVAGLAAAGYLWGLPYAAKRIAYALPVPVHEAISSGALATMDRVFFKPTSVDTRKQQEIRARFNTLVENIELADAGADVFQLQLHFRNIEIAGEQIPNALALPGGDIIVTDGLLPLIDDPRELDSILLHEIGHVLERHGMQHVIQASTITVMASLALGNPGGAADLVTGVPIFLLQSRYSRRSETDADTFAFEQMLKAGIDPIHFANAIRNITGDQSDDASDGAGGYFSSHPGTQERARRASSYLENR
ncbi:hypothetical protein AB833_01575 [Chromatiales bacterium (ex Bugula neritina AB1)]|nr:hypothetical protein AB833_01575 [Chromatiales bacterium (ex Bugula neritina AB1)]